MGIPDPAAIINELGIRVEKTRAGGRVLICYCPLCRSPKAKMEVNLDNRVFFSNCCHQGGKITTLWAWLRTEGNEARAWKDIQAWSAGSVSQRAAVGSRLIVPEPKKSYLIADDHKLNQVYSDFLSQLSLTARHRQNLRERGLPDELIDRIAFKTLPEAHQQRWAICRDLHERYDLADVPGFSRRLGRKGGQYWTCCARGMLIPVRQGHHIIGLQVRQDEGSPKYFAFSCHGQSDGRKWPLVLPGKGIPWIIEGILKAYIVWYFLRVPVIGIHGTAAFKHIPNDVVAALRTKGAVVTAYDCESNICTLGAEFALAEWLSEQGIIAYGAHWTKEMGKGLDDACLSIHQKRPGELCPELFVPHKATVLWGNHPCRGIGLS